MCKQEDNDQDIKRWINQRLRLRMSRVANRLTQLGRDIKAIMLGVKSFLATLRVGFKACVRAVQNLFLSSSAECAHVLNWFRHRQSEWLAPTLLYSPKTLSPRGPPAVSVS